jgi:hypothetical protein
MDGAFSGYFDGTNAEAPARILLVHTAYGGRRDDDFPRFESGNT